MADQDHARHGVAAREERPGPTVDSRAMAVAVTVPLLAAATVLGTNAWLGDRLGDVIVTHWGSGGVPDGYSGRTGFVVMMVLLGAALPFAIMVAGGRARVMTALRRSLLGVGTWLAVFTSGLGTLCLVVQRDGAQGVIGAAPEWMMLGAVPLGVVAALVPRDLVPPVPATTPPAPHLPRSPADGVPVHAVGRGSTLVVADGVLTVRLWWWTPVRIPVVEVTEAHVAQISAWDWGGWGLRFQPGTNRYAYVAAGRDAVELHKADGTRWLLTTPRAEEVAGVVNGIADRQHRA